MHAVPLIRKSCGLITSCHFTVKGREDDGRWGKRGRYKEIKR